MRCSLVLLLSLLAGLAQAEDSLFDRLDTNKDGQVTADEIPQEKQSLFERMLRTSDKNKDGKLTAAEMTAALTPEKSPPEQPAPANGNRNPDREAIFKRIDANNDGQITKEEAPAFLKPRFDQIDANKDGVIQLPELLRAGMRPNAQNFNPKQIFQRLDANDDGKLVLSEVPKDRRADFQRAFDAFNTDSLTLEQFTRLMQRIQQQQRQKQAASVGPRLLLRALDSNGDGEISAEEIAKADKSLAKLDRNSDGAITKEELAPK